MLYPVKKLIALTDEQVEQIARFRDEKAIRSEAEAIRQLIMLGLKAAK
ncbi:hypothetical protein [Paracoccus sp. Arc7-R13]|nr:hypothetical protein [Paracoccus sp. Arc7-R13]